MSEISDLSKAIAFAQEQKSPEQMYKASWSSAIVASSQSRPQIDSFPTKSKADSFTNPRLKRALLSGGG